MTFLPVYVLNSINADMNQLWISKATNVPVLAREGKAPKAAPSPHVRERGWHPVSG